MKQAENMKSL